MTYTVFSNHQPYRSIWARTHSQEDKTVPCALFNIQTTWSGRQVAWCMVKVRHFFSSMWQSNKDGYIGLLTGSGQMGMLKIHYPPCSHFSLRSEIENWRNSGEYGSPSGILNVHSKYYSSSIRIIFRISLMITFSCWHHETQANGETNQKKIWRCFSNYGVYSFWNVLYCRNGVWWAASFFVLDIAHSRLDLESGFAYPAGNIMCRAITNMSRGRVHCKTMACKRYVPLFSHSFLLYNTFILTIASKRPHMHLAATILHLYRTLHEHPTRNIMLWVLERAV
jgi:hypothetical protein